MPVVIAVQAGRADLADGILGGLEMRRQGGGDVGRFLAFGANDDDGSDAGPRRLDVGPGIAETAQGIAGVGERDDGAGDVLVVGGNGGVDLIIIRSCGCRDAR